MSKANTDIIANDASPTTTRLRYPGELGWPPVPVSFDVPLGWEAEVVDPDVTFVREPATAETGTAASITFARDRVGALATLDTVAAGLLRDGEEAAAEFGVYDERVTSTNGHGTVWREQGLVSEPGGDPVVQIVQMTLVPVAEGAMQDLLLLIVTVPASRRDDGVAVAELVRDSMEIDA